MKEHRIILAGGALALLVLPGRADELVVSYVTDTSNDSVVRLQDLDDDGTYNGTGESVVYYDDTIGSIALSNNVGIAMDDEGIVYVCDSSQDIVMACIDLDGDGECNDAGEHWLFFDGDPLVNGSGIEMSSSSNMCWTPDGKLWVASADTGGGGFDYILWLEDQNFDDDANDPGEAFVYYHPPNSGSIGDTIPQDIKLGPDGAMYYLETGSTGMYSKGIYRLEDTNGDFMINPGTGEVTLFYEPPALANTPFPWQFTVAADGFFYYADTGNEVVWKFRDENDDNVVTVGTEDVQYWTGVSSSLIWSVGVPLDNSLYCNESQAPDRMLRMVDGNTDGTIDPATEVEVIYDEGLADVNIGNPRGLYLYVDTSFGNASCFGDGSGTTPCPCGNPGGAGEGCANSTGVGATIVTGGSPSVVADDLTLSGSGLIGGQSALLFVGHALINGGNGTTFGDGLRCAGAGITRLGVKMADPAGDAMWGPGLVAAYGAWGVAETVVFQIWYRDPVGSPCDTEQNTSHAVDFGTEP